MHNVNVDREGHYGIDPADWRLRFRQKTASALRRVRYLLGKVSTV